MRGYAFAITLLACICWANALMCHVCNSLTDPDCEVGGDQLGNKYLTNCSIGRMSGSTQLKAVADAVVCWKQRQDIEGQIIVDRSCGRDAPENRNNCYDRVGTKKIKVRYCVCDRPNCNGAGTLAGSAATFLFLLLAGFYVRSAAI